MQFWCAIFMVLSVVGGWYGYIESDFIPAAWLRWPAILSSLLLSYVILSGSKLFKLAKEKETRFKYYLILLISPIFYFIVILMSLTHTLPEMVMSTIPDEAAQCRDKYGVSDKIARCTKKCRYFLKIDGLNGIFNRGLEVKKWTFSRLEIGDKILVVGKKADFGVQVERIKIIRN